MNGRATQLPLLTAAVCGVAVAAFLTAAPGLAAVTQEDEPQKVATVPNDAADTDMPQAWQLSVVPAGATPFDVPAGDALTPEGVRADGRLLPWYELQSVTPTPPTSQSAGSFTLVENVGGVNAASQSVGSAKLRGGYHRIHVAYLHERGQPTLSLEIKGPAFAEFRPVPASLLYRLREPGEDSVETATALDSDGFRPADRPTSLRRQLHARVHELPAVGGSLQLRDVRRFPVRGLADLESVRPPDGPLTPPAETAAGPVLPPLDELPADESSTNPPAAATPQAAPGFATPPPSAEPPLTAGDRYAVILSGLLRLPKDGEYEFRLTSDGVSRLSVGALPPDLRPAEVTSIGGEAAAARTEAGTIKTDRPPDTAYWRLTLSQEGAAIGLPRELAGGRLTLDIPGLETPVSLPRPLLREMWRTDLPVDDRRAALSEDAVEAEAGQDVLYAAGRSGEIRGVAGTLKGFTAETVTFTIGDADRELPLNRVRGVRFAGPSAGDASDAGPSSGPQLLVHVLGLMRLPADLTGVDFSVQPGRLEFTPSGGDAAVSVPLSQVGEIRVLGGRTVRLTELTPERQTTPLLDLPPAWGVDRSPSGSRLQVGTRRFERGFCVGPRTVLTFPLDGRFNSFSTRLGMQAGESQGGHAVVRVRADGELLYENPALQPREESEEVRVNLQGRQQLTLEVDFGPGGDTGDLVVWGDPQLIRNEDGTGDDP